MPWSKSGRHGTASVTSYNFVRMTISKTNCQPSLRLFTMIPAYSGQCRGSAYGLNEVTMHTVPDCQRRADDPRKLRSRGAICKHRVKLWAEPKS